MSIPMVGLWDWPSGSLMSHLSCLILVPTNCEYVDQPGTYLPFTDTYIPSVTDIEECRSQCSAQGQYNCRSFNFNAFRKECFLSSDDAVSMIDGLQNDRDFTFSARAGCNSGNQDFGSEGVKGKEKMSETERGLKFDYFPTKLISANSN